MGETEQTAVLFTSHDIDFKLENKSKIIKWLLDTAKEFDNNIVSLNYYFCDDKAIKGINQSYLSHDYETDIITFPYEYKPVEAEIYISVETVKSNATRYGVRFDQELLRVIIHGLLHMLGFDDKTEEKQAEMTTAENKFLQIFMENNQLL